MEKKKNEAEVLENIKEKLQKFSNMSKTEQEEKIVRAVGAPSSAALARIKWFQDQRAESIGHSMERVW